MQNNDKKCFAKQFLGFLYYTRRKVIHCKKGKQKKKKQKVLQTY